MGTLRNEKKLAALKKEICEERPRCNLAQNSSVPRWQKDYNTQVSEEIEGRVMKKLSQAFSRTENRILGALARLDEFIMNPLNQGHSGTAPKTSRNAFSVNQGTNEDESQSEPHPEAGLFHNQTTGNSDPEDGHGMVTRIQKECPYGHDRYVVGTYPPSTHICTSCKRYAVVTCRFIILVHVKSTYPIRVILVNCSLLGQNRYGATDIHFFTVFLYYY